MYNTESKKILLDIFDQNKDKAYTSLELLELLKDKMNKTTVYRQLKSLEEDNTIRKTYNDSLKVYEYQLSYECHNHIHLKCIRCGKIIHLSCKDAEVFISHIFENHGFMINKYSSTLQGTCKECRLC